MTARFSGRQAAFFFLVAAVFDVMLGQRGLRGVLNGGLINPDSYMRLIRLEDSVRTLSLVHIIPRDSSGLGTELRWTHLLDAIVLLLAAPFAPFMSLHAALHAGGVLLGPVAMGLLGVALAWSIAPLCPARDRWLAALAAGLSFPIVAYSMPGIVHHHIPVAVAIVTSLGWALRAPARGAAAGVMMGMSAAIAIILTPEATPFLLMGLGGLGLAWALRPETGTADALRAAGIAQALLLGTAFAVDPPAGGYAMPLIDRLSIVWVGYGLAGVGIGFAAASLRPRVGVPAAFACLGLWLAAFPNVLRGPDGLMPPDMAQAFFTGIAEMQPIDSLGTALVFLTPGVLGVGFLLALRNRFAVYATLCLTCALVLAVLHIRFSTYPALAGAALFPVAMSRAHPVLRAALLAAYGLTPPAAMILLPIPGGPSPGCAISTILPMLAGHDGAIVLANPNDTPELLYRTTLKTVGSLYHASPEGFLRLRAAWRSPGTGPISPAVTATGATLVLACPSPRRSALVADLPPTTLLDALNAGTPPPWLTMLSKSEGAVLYAVSR